MFSRRNLNLFGYSTNNRCIDDDIKALAKCWTLRKSWWPSFHFRPRSIECRKTESRLLLAKACVAALLLGPGMLSSSHGVSYYTGPRLHTSNVIYKHMLVTSGTRRMRSFQTFMFIRSVLFREKINLLQLGARTKQTRCKRDPVYNVYSFQG